MNIVIAIIVLVALFGGMGYMAFNVISKTDPNKTDTSTSEEIDSAQDALPFADIKDSMVHMGNHNYRAYIEVSSLNYNLLDDMEQQMVEMSYQNFLNSLNFDIVTYVSTREMDYSNLIEKMYEDYEETAQIFPQMSEYLNQNLQDMQGMAQQLGTTHHKKKYIILTFDAKKYSKQDDEEKYETALRELDKRSKLVQKWLSRIGLTSIQMNTIQIMDLLMQTYNRDGSKFGEALFNGELTSMIMGSGEDVKTHSDTSAHEDFDLLLNEMQQQLEVQFLDKNDIPNEAKEQARKMWERIMDERKHEEFHGFKKKQESLRKQREAEERKRKEEEFNELTEGYKESVNKHKPKSLSEMNIIKGGVPKDGTIEESEEEFEPEEL